MIDSYKKRIISNSEYLNELKETIKSYYDKDVEIIQIDKKEIDTIKDEEELKAIINKQAENINKLNMIIDFEVQKARMQYFKKTEELKKKEKDKVFSEFYRNGIINVKGIDVSVDRFFIKEIEKEGEKIFNFICTDSRIEKKVFGTIQDRDWDVINIFVLKNSKVFYEMYLNKNLFKDNKIILDTDEQMSLFMSYIKKWKNENHKMVAETMYNG